MKEYLFTLIFIGMLTIVTAQQKKSPVSKEETIEWISQKIRQYSYKSSDGEVIHNYNLSLKDEYLIIRINSTLVSNLGVQELQAIERIPIKLIETVYFQDKPDNYWLTINMKGGANVIITQFDGLSPQSVSSTEIILSKSLDNENLKERLLKSFNHLIELYTGKTKKEPF